MAALAMLEKSELADSARGDPLLVVRAISSVVSHNWIRSLILIPISHIVSWKLSLSKTRLYKCVHLLFRRWYESNWGLGSQERRHWNWVHYLREKTSVLKCQLAVIYGNKTINRCIWESLTASSMLRKTRQCRINWWIHSLIFYSIVKESR